MSRRPLFAANWKMHKTPDEAEAFVAALLAELGEPTAEVVLAPAAVALERTGRALAGSPVGLAAQNVHPEPAGAFTGELSVGMLAAVGCRYAIVGHSERRHLFGEDDAFVARKVRALLDGGLTPIVCIGESLEEREAGRTLAVVEGQLQGSLAGVSAEEAAGLVLAYEPVWAIGTGRTATPDSAQEVHAAIRARLADTWGPAAERIRIQYGGSVKPDNVAALLAQPDIDGALVGGASLEPDGFLAVVHYDSRPDAT